MLEVLGLVTRKYKFLGKRADEIRNKVVRFLRSYMEGVDSEEEMRFLLLDRDLDQRDALTNINDYDVLELLDNKYAESIAMEIWESKFNVRGGLFITSTSHNLLFNYWHARSDEEERLRFYRPRDLKALGCHPFQFQVWRFSGRSRYYVELIALIGLVAAIHYFIARFLNRAYGLLDDESALVSDRAFFDDSRDHNSDEFNSEYDAIFAATEEDIRTRAVSLYEDAMTISYFGFLVIGFGLQNIFRAIFAGKSKRQIYIRTWENAIDIVLFWLFFSYIMVTYAYNLRGSWIDPYTKRERSDFYWDRFKTDHLSE